MIEDVGAGLAAEAAPRSVGIGDRDQVEHEAAFPGVFARFRARATLRILTSMATFGGTKSE
jgi:hypothetical protein